MVQKTNRYSDWECNSFVFNGSRTIVRATVKMALLVIVKTPNQKLTNFFDCVQPICVLARIYGLLSFSISYAPNGEIENCRLRVVNIFYAMLNITLCLVSSVLNFMHLIAPENEWGMIFLYGMHFFLISATLLAAVSIALDIINRNRLIEMLQKINHADKQVH